MIGTNGMNAAEVSSAARAKMEEHIQRGLKSAQHLLEHIHTQVPHDSVMRGRRASFLARDGRVALTMGDPGANAGRLVHRHALSQIAQKAGMGAASIVEEAFAPEQWKRDLAAARLNAYFHNTHENAKEDPSAKRYLVRSVNEEVRGFLSDRYRRIDSRPTLEAFAEECQAVNAVPVEGIVTDLRVSLRALIPVVYEPVPGEVMCFGAEWGNSDFGAAKHSFRTFILRLTCLNGATMQDTLSQVHTGGRLADNIEFSQRTYELDTRAQVSALRDIVRHSLAEKNVETMINMVRAAHEERLDWKRAGASIAKQLTKAEAKLVKDAFESEDTINLPPVRSKWRLSNAISWLANSDSVEVGRKLELQRMAGKILNGVADDEDVAS